VAPRPQTEQILSRKELLEFSHRLSLLSMMLSKAGTEPLP
jgi:hypothetical protein